MRKVKSSLYSKKYYLTSCSGYKEFRKKLGKSLEPRFRALISEIPVRKGMRVLDIGCGRGEMVFWAVNQEASAVGIDYSEDAVSLAKMAQKHQGKTARKLSEFYVMDAEELNFPEKSFDAVFLIEILEHLYPEQQSKVFMEIFRVLKEDGFVFLHTAPNRLFNDFAYRFWCYPLSTFVVSIWNFLNGKKYANISSPKKLRGKWERLMHVNEPDYRQLKNLFQKSGFLGELRSTNITIIKPELSWKDKLFNFLVYLYPLSKYFPFNLIWGNDFYAVLKKK